MITKTSDHEVQTKNNIPKNPITVLKQRSHMEKVSRKLRLLLGRSPKSNSTFNKNRSIWSPFNRTGPTPVRADRDRFF